MTPSETIYIELRLIGPPDNAVLSREEAALLRWISVDVLDPNEWYVLLVYPVSGSAQTLLSIWTKATSYRLDASWRWRRAKPPNMPGRCPSCAPSRASTAS